MVTDKVEVLNVALLLLNVPVPNVVEPALKVTVPVGVPPDEVTVAVKVTDWPKVDGFTDDVSDVEVLAAFTVWVRTGEVLPRMLPLPLYTAVIELDPAVSVEIVNVAFPALSVLVPSVEELFLKVTVPVGVPLDAVTVAVKVTDLP